MSFYPIFASNLASIGVGLKRCSDGFWWYPGTPAWTSVADPPTLGNASTTMTAGTGTLLYSHRATFSASQLGSPGWCWVYYWDLTLSTVVYVDLVYITEVEEVARAAPVYHGQCDFEATSSGDKYTVTFFVDNVLITSGITSPTIQVISRATGSDLIASVSLGTAVVAGTYKKDEASALVGSGGVVIVRYGMTHNGAVRTFNKLVGRDR